MPIGGWDGSKALISTPIATRTRVDAQMEDNQCDIEGSHGWRRHLAMGVVVGRNNVAVTWKRG